MPPEGLEAQLASVARSHVELTAEIAELRTLINNQRALCPYREDISRASNNSRKLDTLVEAVNALREDNARAETIPTRLGELERTVKALELNSARAGAAGGGVVSLVALIVVGIGKILSWW